MGKKTKSTSNASLMPNLKNIDLESLFVAPEKNDTTKIAGYLAKCIVPIKIGILDIPRKIILAIEDMSQSAESILPLEAAEVYHMACQIDNRMMSRASKVDIKDIIELFTFEAVQTSSSLVNQFIKIIQIFCQEIETVQKQVASENSFYMVQTLGTEAMLDSSLIVVSVQNLIHNLNTMASGLEGFKIISLGKLINTIDQLMSNEEIKKFSVFLIKWQWLIN